MAKSKGNFKAYGIFDRLNKNRVAVIHATKMVRDFTSNVYTFYFAHIVIGKVDMKTCFVVELM